jgi:hypothetical protein
MLCLYFTSHQTFLCTSSEKVTGSSWSISFLKEDNTRGLIVLECGLDQSEPTIERLYQSNKRMLDNIGKEVVESAMCVVLAHCH